MSSPSPIPFCLLVVSSLSLVQPNLGFLSPPSFLAFGYCKDTAVQPGLDLREFSGLWYTVEKVPNEYDPDVACTNTNYAYYGDHLRSSQKGLLVDRSKHRINTVLMPTNDTDPVLMVHNPGVPVAPLKILATDYQNYACMYTCMDFVAFKAEFAFTLTRAPIASFASLEACREVYSEEVGLQPSSMILVEQGKTCPYWSNLSHTLTTFLQRQDDQIQASRQIEVTSATSSSSPLVFGVVSLLLLVFVASRS